jgi:GNAT superfamily N-acetyltransferase
MRDYTTVPLNSSHKKKEFKCGKELLDNYLHRQAKQDVKRKLAVCFVLFGEESKVQGYYTLSNAGIQRSYLPVEIATKLPKSYNSYPVTLLGRLAVDLHYAGNGLGELLLLDALKRCWEVSVNSIGSLAVIVNPIDKSAARFYKKYGFIPLPDSGKMFLPMKTIAALFS